MKSKKPPALKQTWDIMPFGKYIGKTLHHVATTDPEYLEWYKANSNIEFSENLQKLISQSKNLLK